MAKLYQWL